MARPRAACFLPVILRMVLAMVSAAPDFSSRVPVTVPSAMTRPISAMVPPMPLVKALSMSCMFMPATMAKVAEVAISAKNGWIFSLTVKRTNTRTANTRPRITDTVEPINKPPLT